MKLVQTLWIDPSATQNYLPDGGWLHSKYHMMSWQLSCLLLRKNHPDLALELVTDSAGKHLLVDTLGLPYTSVSTALDALPFQVPKDFWAAKLIYSYAQHQEPFLNVDSDFFAFAPFPSSFLNGAVVAQNIEQGQAMELYALVLDDVKEKVRYVPDFVQHTQQTFSINAGIIGGQQFTLFHEFFQEVFNFFELVKSKLKYLQYPKGLNTLAEQYFFSSFATYKGHTVNGLLPPVNNTDYAYMSQFENICNPYPYLHTTLGAKQKPETTELLEIQLRSSFPNEYIALIERLSQLGVQSQDKLKRITVSQSVAIANQIHTQNNSLENEDKFFFRTRYVTRVLENKMIRNGEERPRQLRSTSSIKRIISSIERYERKRMQFVHSQRRLSDEVVLKDKFEKILLVNIFKKLPITEALTWSVKIAGNFKLISSSWNWVYLSDESALNTDRVNEVLTFKGYYQMLLLRVSSDSQIIEYLLDNVEILLLNEIRKKKKVDELISVLESFYSEAVSQVGFKDVMRQTVFDKIRKLSYKGVIKLYRPT